MQFLECLFDAVNVLVASLDGYGLVVVVTVNVIKVTPIENHRSTSTRLDHLQNLFMCPLISVVTKSHQAPGTPQKWCNWNIIDALQNWVFGQKHGFCPSVCKRTFLGRWGGLEFNFYSHSRQYLPINCIMFMISKMSGWIYCAMASGLLTSKK